uniref:Zinc finger PHD-type domain-containing protein n=1 Tax=Cacopsylla melanoneura TaxID=428564 RepID=A0A8D8QQM8_9HEMI
MKKTVVSTPSPIPGPSSSKFVVSPKALLPPPEEESRAPKTIRKNRGKAAILTSSPYKEELEMQNKEKEKPKRKVKAAPKKKVEKVKKPKIKIEAYESSSSSEEEPSDIDACIYCNALTCESKQEGLIQCVKCKLYAHEACARAEELDQNFTCDICAVLLQ